MSSQLNIPSETSKLKFKTQGGNYQEDLVLQNIQARTRLISSYLISQILQAKGVINSFLLVIGTGNCSEINRGYFTKYDNSSGDINLIGDLCKQDIFTMLQYFMSTGSSYYWLEGGKKPLKEKFLFIQDIISALPTAELRPETNTDIGRPIS